MFTGLVEGQGTVSALERQSDGILIVLQPDDDCFPTAEISIGDSIAICGCCLTVITNADQNLSFEAGQETLSKTNLGQLKVGDRVNLERSLSVGDRLGGHIVQGHVDGLASVDLIDRSGEWVDMWFRLAPELTALMVPKGSVAVDGISLTIVNVEEERFSVALIPHTLEVTTLGQRDVGDPINIENDIIGKYVARLIAGDTKSPYCPS